jgi:alpha-L-fucosidase 2
MRSLKFVCLVMTVALPGLSLDQKDVEYGRPEGASLLLDLHVPEGNGPFPAAILVHGGGFDQGSKSTNVRPCFQPLSNAGYAWFSIDYRLAPKAHFQQAIADVYTAIDWVRKNADQYHVNRKKIVLIGESAGGYLVNYAGTHLKHDSDIAAVVDFYGPSEYGVLSMKRKQHPDQFDMASISRHAANGGGIHFFGVNALDQSGLARLHEVAPIAGVHKGMPPFLCIHGDKDDQVSFDQTPPFCDAIRKVGSECEIIRIEGGAHGMNRWKEESMQHWKGEMVAWLNKELARK